MKAIWHCLWPPLSSTEFHHLNNGSVHHSAENNCSQAYCLNIRLIGQLSGTASRSVMLFCTNLRKKAEHIAQNGVQPNRLKCVSASLFMRRRTTNHYFVLNRQYMEDTQRAGSVATIFRSLVHAFHRISVVASSCHDLQGESSWRRHYISFWVLYPLWKSYQT